MRVVYTDHHALHATDNLQRDGTPFVTEEVPARAEIILGALQTEGIGVVVAPTDHSLVPILAVHDRDYVDFLRNVFAESAAYYKVELPVFPDAFATRRIRRKPDGFLGLRGYYAFGDDSPIVAGTWTAAYWSAQCALTAADEVRAGEPCAYALCRPPGHHAAADLYGGACYLNHAAIAARYLQLSPLLQAGGPGVRLAILDIDYHHGNGTQEIFYADPTVLCCSLHAHPDFEYPYYWGGADERGEGAGEGFNRNWPLPIWTDDAAYLAALDEALRTIREFDPAALVVSAGFDIVTGDPWGGFNLTLDGLREIGRRVAALGRPAVIVQEGGYRRETLGACAVAFLRVFAAEAG